MLKKLLERQLKRQKTLSLALRNTQGFTLIELLIVVIISSIIVSALLTLVVQLIGTEQRESVRTETQREAQLALNYIASDLRQAVYIYDGRVHPQPAAGGSTPSYIDFLPDALQNQDNYRPVLAFWKTKPIEDIEATALPAFNPDSTSGAGCGQFVAGANLVRFNECNNLWLRRQNYSLVAYFQAINDTTNTPDNKWKGKSRIVRYELDKYTDAGLATLTRTPGYVDPAEIGSDGFANWPYGAPTVAGPDPVVDCQTTSCADAAPAGEPDGGPQTLVDFVDLVTPATSPKDLALRNNEPDDCGALNITGNTIDTAGNSVIPAGGGNPAFIEYFMTPSKDDVNFPKPAFFICLRNTADRAQPNNPRVGQIQDTVVFLRGNANGRGGTATDSFLPTLETRITMRGVIDRVIR